jgi:hypothetical protein
MPSPNQNKPGGKPGQPTRNFKQRPKPAQPPIQKAASQPEAKAHIAAAVEPADAFSVRATAPTTTNTPTIDLQTIAMAYGDYTKKSFEQTKSFVEKLAGVRSLDKAIEIQTAFAKQAYETFMTDSQKIRELYSGLAKQSFKPLEGAVARMMSAAR